MGFDEEPDYEGEHGECLHEIESLRTNIISFEEEKIETMKNVAILLQAFEDGIFVRSVDRDHESGWAIALLKPLAAMGALKCSTDAAAANSEEND